MDENRNVKPVVGIAEYFNINDFSQAELIIETIRKIGVTELRTVISWADWYARDGGKWYDWLLPALGKNFNLLPCFTYTPPEIAVEPKIFAPPKNPGDYTRFVDIMIKKYGEYFDAVELWNEPNNLNNWDRRLDPEWNIFSEMISSTAELVKNSGKLAVLGGLFPVDPGWLKLMGEKNVLKNFDAAGIHGFHGTWESDWSDWDTTLAAIFDVLKIYKPEMQIWITKAGYSTWKHNEHKQLVEFVKLINAPAGKVYWYSATVSYTHLDVYKRQYFMSVKFPQPKQPQGFPIKNALSLVKESSLILLSLILFFESGLEGITNNWTTRFLEKAGGLTTENALSALTALALSLTVTRLILGGVLKKVQPYIVLYICIIFVIAGSIVLMGTNSLLSAVIAMILLGIGYSAAFPVVLGYVGELYASLSGTAFSIALVIALIGNTFINYLVGVISQSKGIEAFPYIIIISVLLLSVTLLLSLNRISKKIKI